MNPIQVVTVVNDYVQYEHYVKNNPFYQNFDLVHFNNTQENISVPQRYNYFIDHSMSDDAWVMFCHQDFSVNEDLSGKLCGLDKNYIYGPMGIKSYRCLGIILRLKGSRAFTIRKKNFFENKQYGQILHQTSSNGSGPKLAGIKLKKPFEVDTVDSFCLIVHSSLIRKYNLRFDKSFDFNLYGADLSIMARRSYGIKTKALQLDCCHLSGSRKSSGYYRCLSRLVKKYPEERIAVTFSDEREIEAFRYFFANQQFGQAMDNFISVKEDL